MKRIIIIAGIGISLIVCSLFALNIWTGSVVKENIRNAKQQYHGTAEDALLSLLMDENISANDRTHTAIWTLGQIRSEKALPILQNLYKDDPDGETCFGNHDSVLCQYEIYKAIESIEKRMLFSHAKLNE